MRFVFSNCRCVLVLFEELCSTLRWTSCNWISRPKVSGYGSWSLQIRKGVGSWLWNQLKTNFKLFKPGGWFMSHFKPTTSASISIDLRGKGDFNLQFTYCMKNEDIPWNLKICYFERQNIWQKCKNKQSKQIVHCQLKFLSCHFAFYAFENWILKLSKTNNFNPR